MKALPAIQPALPHERQAVSAAEERLLLAHLAGVHHLNPIQICARHRGRISVPRFHRALQSVVARHEALRTVFSATPTAIARDIRADLGFDFRVLSHTDPCPDRLDAVLRDLARAMVAAPYDNATGPILRLTLIRSADGCDYIVINVSHLACDAASLSLLLRSLFHAYADPDGFASIEPGLQAIDFVASQARFLKANDPGLPRTMMARQEGQRMTVTPFGRHRDGARPPDRLAVSVHPLPERYTRSAQRQAKAMAAAALVIAAIDPEASPALLLPRMNRSALGAKDIIGYLANTIVVPLEIEPNRTASQLLVAARRSLRSAAALESIPYALLVGQLHDPPNVSLNFFPAAFARDWPSAWTVHPSALVPSMTTAFEIGVYLADPLGELHLQYFDDMLSADEAARCGAMFVHAVGALERADTLVGTILAELRADLRC